MFDPTSEPFGATEALLALRIRRYTDQAVVAIDPTAIAAAAAQRAGARVLPLTRTGGLVLGWAAVVGLMAAALLGAMLFAGGRPSAAPGLVFSQGGEIVVMDPVTGDRRTLGRGNDPTWAPDHSMIAFEIDDRTWVMNGDGTHRLELSRHGPDAVWSPDGRALLVADSVFTVLPVDGSAAHDLAASPWKDAGNGSWSPDGSRVVLAARNHLVVVDGEGASPPVTIRNLEGAMPWKVRWSPDGKHIAFDDRDGIHIIDPDGRNDRLLVPVDEPYANSIEWAPDSQRLAYTLQTQANAMLVDLHSGETRILFRPADGRNAVDVAWSPDGAQIAVTVARAFNEFDPGAGLWIVDRAGISARQVVERFDWQWEGGPGW